MKNSRFYVNSKTGGYLQFGNDYFQIKNNGLLPISENELRNRISLSMYWNEVENSASELDVLNKFIIFKSEEKRLREEKNADRMERIENSRAITYDKALALINNNQPIEATVENVRLVLVYLNEQNWGSWTLPKMTIGYSANQYDCDGSQATTIKLDKKISCLENGIENECMFKIGGSRGHLNKYQRL